MTVGSIDIGTVAALVIVGAWLAVFFWPRPRIVREHQRALRFTKGRLVAELGPGRHWLRRRVEDLILFDVRRRQLVIAGQEVLTADRVPLKISLIAEFAVRDTRKAYTVVDSYEQALYGRVQLAVREAVARRDLDTALTERGELGQEITGLVADSVAEFGIELHGTRVRDFMMGGGLRSAYADVIQARQQGLAALERARAESAALRNLANSAELLERHPGLMRLRLLQAVEAGAASRIVLSVDPEGPQTSRATSAGTDDLIS